MIPRKLIIEAENCRRLAGEYQGRPEQPFLLKVAALFEDLARADSHDQTGAKVNH